MKVVNTTQASRQIDGNDPFRLTVELSRDEAKAIIRGRRDLRKATISEDLQSQYDVDVVNGIVMIAGSVLEDEGRDERSVDFDSRHG